METPIRYIQRGCLLLLALAMSACAFKSAKPAPVEPPPPSDSYVVLMKNDDGTTGRIIYSDNQNNSVNIEQPGVGVLLDSAKEGAFAVPPEKIALDFAGASSVRPKLPVSFMLYFVSGGVKLTPESEALITSVLQEVKDRPAPDVSIIGHTDTVGKAADNEALALKRAQAIAAKINAAGLTARDVTVTSHGERNLLIKTPDETPEPRNRRVEITVR